VDQNINYLILFDSLSLFHLSQGCKKKAQDITSKNVTPHLMSRSGYRKLEESFLNEEEQSKQGIASEIDIGFSKPPSPPTRHQKWKMARMKKFGYI